MAGIIFCDGFLTTPNSNAVNSCYNWNYRGGTQRIESTGTRTGGYCKRLGDATASTSGCGRNLGANYSELWIGFAIYLSSATTISGNPLLSANDGSETAQQVRVVMVPPPFPNQWKFALQKPDGTNIQIGTTALSSNQWYYVELYLLIHGSAGKSIMKLWDLSGDIRGRGVTPTEEWNLTGIDTQATANAYTNYIRFWDYAYSGSSSNRLDDVYVADDQFQGPVRIYRNLPTGDGDLSQWTPLAGAHYTNVDEAPTTTTRDDSDTSYNSAGTNEYRDLYTFPSFEPDGRVRCVQAEYSAREDAGLSSQLIPIVKSDGTVYEGSGVAMSSTYVIPTAVLKPWPLDPALSYRWTGPTIDAAQWGQEALIP